MKKTSPLPYILTGIILVVLLAVGGIFAVHKMKPSIVKDAGDNMSDYSAVFVNGGGIYFGKITSITPDAVVIDNVYTYGVVPTDSSANTTDSSTKPTLFDASKVGIAPASHYNINRNQVILWYSLKNDSDVVKTIQNYQQTNS